MKMVLPHTRFREEIDVEKFYSNNVTLRLHESEAHNVP